jgi:hypothetical protein
VSIHDAYEIQKGTLATTVSEALGAKFVQLKSTAAKVKAEFGGKVAFGDSRIIINRAPPELIANGRLKLQAYNEYLLIDAVGAALLDRGSGAQSDRSPLTIAEIWRPLRAARSV